MNDNSVQLARHFSLVPQSEDDSDENEINSLFGSPGHSDWKEVEKEFRCVIIAEAGAGKSFEMKARAEHIKEQGRAAFFIRIEDIGDYFETAFEVGNEECFEKWLSSKYEAWFFLDSVDESRLKNPRDFEKAIRRFATRIKPAQHRARVFISSRPYAWRPHSDRNLLEQYLPHLPLKTFTQKDKNNNTKEVVDRYLTKPESALRVFSLNPLDEESIRLFAECHDTPKIDELIGELDRTNLMLLAARPFDLKDILAKWKIDQTLHGRLDMLQNSIDIHLKEIDPNRGQRQQINHEEARRGARLLAAATILTGEPGILVPESSHPENSIDATRVLGDWKPEYIRILLGRGLFNDALYGAVRFRHREVRDLLAAEWFRDQLTEGNSHHKIESLLFRRCYHGHLVITPRLRPVMPWLIIFNDDIRHKTLEIAPEVIIEGGDVAYLPNHDRKKILHNIVKRIAKDEDNNIAYDNSAILRIAQPDLEDDVLNLVKEHHDNEKVIFFLSRLALHGQMKALVPVLSKIAGNPGRDIYSRINATHAVMTCGTHKEATELWKKLLALPDILPHKLLVAVMKNAHPDKASVNFLLSSIEKLETFERYEMMDLSKALHDFIDRLQAEGAHDALKTMVIELNKYLNLKPCMHIKHIDVSEEFAWLLSPAAHAVEHLVSDHSSEALLPEVLEVMIKVPTAQSFSNEHYDKYKNQIHKIVPTWKKLNDALFWLTVEKEREKITDQSKSLTNVTSIIRINHYWGFEIERFDDVLGFVSKRNFLDDKLVALSLAYQIFLKDDKSKNLLSDLKRVAGEDPILKEHLDNLLEQTKIQNASILEQSQHSNEEDLETQEEASNLNKEKWVKHLKASPDTVRHPPGLQSGQISNDQCFLLETIEDLNESPNNLSHGANWKILIPEFGEDVAKSYRDAAVAHWREYTPSHPSETNLIPPSLVFAMGGIEIESREVDDFPSNLKETEVDHALRYLLWELNSFPSWFEQLYNSFPCIVRDVVLKELYQEINCRDPNQTPYHILQKLIYSAPWIHSHLAPEILNWMKKNEISNHDILRDCIRILHSGNANAKTVLNLATSKIKSKITPKGQLSVWYALWIDIHAERGILAAEEWLSGLPKKDAKKEAQLLVTKLNRTSWFYGAEGGHNELLKVKHLKALYILMHKYIRVQEDIDRATGKAYSPELRDDAQRSRDALLYQILKIPGKDSYVALADLAENHPYAKYRPWMDKLAKKHAEENADLEPWSAPKVWEYSQNQVMTPTTHKELFDLTVNRLIDLKNWIEGGNYSPYKTWQRASSENEIRNLVAGWLNITSSGRLICTQESELANKQKPDIWTHNTHVISSLPIELKVLKNWTGPNLCERLRNQLAGDYLREENARYGIFLLVCREEANRTRKWVIDGNRVTLPDLPNALDEYWKTVSSTFTNVEEIKTILIDMTVRGVKSTS